MAPDLYGTSSVATDKVLDSATKLHRSDADWQRRCEEAFPALNATVFLDHAASTPASSAAIQSFANDCARNLYSNPHSRSVSSVSTSQKVDQMRERVLSELFGLHTAEQRLPWEVVWTSGATAALKLVGENFPWQSGSSRYEYLKQSHTSLVGIRGAALARGADVKAYDHAEEMARRSTTDESALFGYSAQSNVTGQRLGLSLCRRLKRQRPSLKVALDAASYLSTSVLDLSQVDLDEAPDFVACSFYKIYGWPTGLGCLVVKRSSASHLRKDGYFGGGTVDFISLNGPFVQRARNSASNVRGSVHARFEDGTLPYLDIISLGHAMDDHARLFGSHAHVSEHATYLATRARSEMSAMRHFNGLHVVKIHRDSTDANIDEPDGPVIGFSLLTWDGKWVGHVQLEQLASINSIQLRTGALCNTGTLASATGLTDEDLEFEHLKGRVCWDDQEFGGVHPEQQKPLGLARISFGRSSTMQDVQAWLDFLQRFYVVSQCPETLRSATSRRFQSATLAQLTVYPIKSCGGQSIPAEQRWPVTPSGLLYDREWMLISPVTGQHLSQKRYTRMVLIKACVDLERDLLLVEAPGMKPLSLPLHSELDEVSSASTDAFVCGDQVRVAPAESAPHVDRWFSDFLGVECSLRRIAASGSRHAHFGAAPGTMRGASVPIHLSNESPYLLISSASNERVGEWIDESDEQVDSACFRANFEIATDDPSAPLEPFEEDDFDIVTIGNDESHGTVSFQKLANCRRCLMVCVDQVTGERTKEPFSALSRNRRSTKGRVEFGIHMMLRTDLSGDKQAIRTVGVGDKVIATRLA